VGGDAEASRGGYRILQAIDFLRPAAEIVLAHQERWDGGGYPHKLRGEAIPLGARILRHRGYAGRDDQRPAVSQGGDVRRGALEISRCGGTQFDPRCVQAFADIPDDELEALRQEHAA